MFERCKRCNQRKDDIRKVVVRKGAADVIRDLCEACRNAVAEIYLVIDPAADEEAMKAGPAELSSVAPGAAPPDAADAAPAPKKTQAKRRRRGRTQSKGGTN